MFVDSAKKRYSSVVWAWSNDKFQEMYSDSSLSSKYREFTSYCRSPSPYLCDILEYARTSLRTVLSVSVIKTADGSIVLATSRSVFCKILSQGWTSWWFQPNWKLLLKFNHLPLIGVNIQTKIETATKNGCWIPKSLASLLPRPSFKKHLKRFLALDIQLPPKLWCLKGMLQYVSWRVQSYFSRYLDV